MKSSILGATLLAFSVQAQPEFDISEAIQGSLKKSSNSKEKKQLEILMDKDLFKYDQHNKQKRTQPYFDLHARYNGHRNEWDMDPEMPDMEDMFDIPTMEDFFEPPVPILVNMPGGSAPTPMMVPIGGGPLVTY